MKSPLPPDHYLTKDFDLLKRKNGEECIRYFLDPDELETIRLAYSQRGCHNGPGPRRRG